MNTKMQAEADYSGDLEIHRLGSLGFTFHEKQAVKWNTEKF